MKFLLNLQGINPRTESSIVSSKDESTDVQLDISKYEGSNTNAWRDAWGVPYTELIEVTKTMDYNGPNECTQADLELWADAPLLLEEVKRLQRKLMLAESALGEIRAYHESGQGNLGEIIEHYQENEQVEMPNALDEDDA